MPKTDIDYSNTVFYKIYCKNPDVKDVYIGHTTNFVQRKHAHKRSCANPKADNYNCKVYNAIREFGGWDNWKMEIIAFRECADHYEARKIEQQYFEQYNATLNSVEPMPKQKVKPPKVIKPEKIIPKCETCNVFFQTKTAHEVHNQTNKHLKMVIKQSTNCDNPEKSSKNAMTHECNTCNYTCVKKSDFTKHLLTAKHKDLMNPNGPTQKVANENICTCGKVYKHMPSLCCHRKTCKIYINSNDKSGNSTDTTADTASVSDISYSPNTIAELLRQNQEFKQLMIDQNKQIQETQAQLQKAYVQNTELQNQIIELFKEGKPSNKFTIPQL
jgi:hypothetical protein